MRTLSVVAQSCTKLQTKLDCFRHNLQYKYGNQASLLILDDTFAVTYIYHYAQSRNYYIPYCSTTGSTTVVWSKSCICLVLMYSRTWTTIQISCVFYVLSRRNIYTYVLYSIFRLENKWKLHNSLQ